ncbi:LysE family transporter [Marinomonas sp. C2222]|uniref:LysE family transporter n=1 Tax=Marinomonas sargassi TaxID=2984494 RepID=A0ABT2YPP3_9GAMM|nr:LysE family transporter [Marinomonas sargassi]MCV2401856.1 LysE family transporter [Marinomonas sargassi]
MSDILLFAFTIMYTPGPVNLIALMAGVHSRSWRILFYSLGVGCAMFLLFLTIGYLGSEVIPERFQRGIAIIGGAYIAYLGVKILIASFQPATHKLVQQDLGFKVGLILQLCNPKSLVVIIPVTGVLFPKAGIVGEQIALWSLLLGLLAFGAPSVYLLAGRSLKSIMLQPNIMAALNRIMGVLLLYVAYDFVLS